MPWIHTKIAFMLRSMDKRELAAGFRERLRTLLADDRGGVAAFLRDSGIDRSALSQFLDPEIDRLPRAESLRRIAEARGVTVDWLLSLSNAPEGRQEVAPSVQIESAEDTGSGSPIDQWRREASGMKLRYVPSARSCSVWNGIAISMSMSPRRKPPSTFSGCPARASAAGAGRSSARPSMSGRLEGT